MTRVALPAGALMVPVFVVLGGFQQPAFAEAASAATATADADADARPASKNRRAAAVAKVEAEAAGTAPKSAPKSRGGAAPPRSSTTVVAERAASRVETSPASKKKVTSARTAPRPAATVERAQPAEATREAEAVAPAVIAPAPPETTAPEPVITPTTPAAVAHDPPLTQQPSVDGMTGFDLLLASSAVTAQPVFRKNADGSQTVLALVAVEPSRLGTAGKFALLAGSTITNTGVSTIEGDIGLHPGSAVTGFESCTGPANCVVLTGAQHLGDAIAEQAKADLVTAYNSLVGLESTCTSVSVELGGTTLLPGVYCSPTFGLTGTLTLDGNDLVDPEFIFLTGSGGTTLITAVGSNVLLVNGADACDVYWQVGSSATLGASSSFSGTILASTSITFGTGATLNGSALAMTGAVTLDNNTITSSGCEAGVTPDPDVPPPDEVIAPPDEVIPPTDEVIPPTDVVIPPTDVVIPPPDVVIPPPDEVIPLPPRVVIPPPVVVVPPPDVVVPPPDVVVPPPDVVVPPPDVVVPPPVGIPTPDGERMVPVGTPALTTTGLTTTGLTTIGLTSTGLTSTDLTSTGLTSTDLTSGGKPGARPGSTLPVTGAPVQQELLLAGLAMGLGSLMVLLSKTARRRRPASTD